MNEKLKSIKGEIAALLNQWEPVLTRLSEETITQRRNQQNRTIKQIVGHMIDSASNNTHRIVHLQYQASPFLFPNYATFGNNDRWIAIQDYQHEDWDTLVQLWKYAYLHISHVIENVDPSKLNQEWVAGPDRNITLEAMIMDFVPHLRLHLVEIQELITMG